LDSLTGLSGYELTMAMPQGELLINQRPYPVPDWGFHYQSSLSDGLVVSLQVPVLDLSHLETYRSLIGHGGLQDTLETLRPRGLLRNIKLVLPLDKNASVEPVLRANLEQVAVAAWQGA